MANFTLQLSVGVTKGAGASWFYVQNSVGHSYGNPVDVQIGDTVTFTRTTSSNGTGYVKLLNIFTNNADVTLTASAPTVVRTIATGGTTLDAIRGEGTVANHGTDDFFLERQAAPSITAPTASSVTFNNPASANTTATVNLSASGSGGTLQYACEVGDSTPDNWQSGSTFTISRGTGTVYARARRSSTDLSNVVSATRPGFLTGDTSVSATSSTITTSAGNATTTISSGTAGETYAVRLNNGSSNLATRTGNGAVLITTSLPTAGNTTTYEIFVRRPTSTGGDGSTYHATNDTFTVTRSADVTPSAFDFTNQTGVALSSTRTSANTITIAGMSTGVTASVTISGGQYSKNLAGYSSQSGITATNGDTFKVRHTSSSSFSTSTTTTLTVGGVSGSFVSTTIADNIAPVITRTGSSIINVTVGGSYSDQGATASDNINGNITSSIVTVNPVNTAVVGTYTVTYNVSDAAGNAATQVTRTVYVNPSAPVVNNTQTFAATASSSTSCNVSLTSSGNGGTLEYNKSTNQVIPTGIWYSTSTVTGLTRGTSYYLWARTANGSAYTDRTDSALTVPYLAPDAAITAIASPDLAYGSTTHVVTIAGGNAVDQYYVYNNAGSVSYGGRTGNGTITITHGVSAGGAATFRVYVRKPIAVGGDNAFDDTGTTFEIEVYPNFPTLSVSNDNPSSASVTATLSATGGEGGTIEYAKTSYSSTTTYAQNRGTSVTYYARSVGANGLISSVSTVSHPVGYIAPDATITAIASQNKSYLSTTTIFNISGSNNTADQYYVYNNAGSVSYGGETGNGDITFTHGVAAGGSGTFRVYARRPLAVGGDNLFDSTNVSGVVVKVYPQTPTASVGFNNPNDNDVTATVTASNTTGSNSLAYSNGGTYVAGNTFGAVRGTAANYYVRSTAANGLTATSAATAATPGYNAPDAAITAIASPDLAYGSTEHM